jgi:hypothetical protein
VGTWLSLAHQTISLEVEFGAHALEALLWVAETVEESVYEPGSLAWTREGLRFALANPPLRAGAFLAIRAELNGAAVPAEQLELRHGEGSAWTPAATICRTAPFELVPGRRTEVQIRCPVRPGAEPVRVRLEFENVAIPPLVWLEFQNTPREATRS